MGRSTRIFFAAGAVLAISLAGRSPAEDPYEGPIPKDCKELFAAMLEMMGNRNVTVAEHHAVMNIVLQIDDRKDLIDTLIDHLEDKRVFDPSMEVPSGNGAKSSYSVGDICGEILRSKFKMHPRSKYEVGSWKEWWKKQSGRKFEEIWREVEAAEHR